jgi:hypothetical protein
MNETIEIWDYTFRRLRKGKSLSGADSKLLHQEAGQATRTNSNR